MYVEVLEVPYSYMKIYSKLSLLKIFIFLSSAERKKNKGKEHEIHSCLNQNLHREGKLGTLRTMSSIKK